MDIYTNQNGKGIDFGEINFNLRRRAYRFLGVGSGRAVFDMGDKYVVKVARNKRGYGQNKAEYNIAIGDDTQLFAKIHGVSENYKLLVMEKAERIQDISYVWDYYNVKSNRELYDLKEFQDISNKYGLMLRDFGRRVNWGKINGRPVIIDYGFTKEVYKKYY